MPRKAAGMVVPAACSRYWTALTPPKRTAPTDGLPRIPGGKDDQCDGNPASSAGQVFGPAGRVGQREMGATQADEHPAYDGPEVACAR